AFPIAAVLCLLLGGLIGAIQGFWVAYFNIPSLLVTLAGMLVFKGLMLAVLGGQSVGPFPVVFQKLSSGFIPEIIGTTGGGYLTSLISGVLLAGFLIWQRVKSRQRHLAHDGQPEPFRRLPICRC